MKSYDEWREEPTYDIKDFFRGIRQAETERDKLVSRTNAEIRSVGREVDEDDQGRRQMLVDVRFLGDKDRERFDRGKCYDYERERNDVF